MKYFFKIVMISIAVFFLCNFTLIDLEEAFEAKKEIDALFFAPDQAKEFKKQILKIIDNTSGSIKAAFYRLTDRDIAQALIAAHNRNIDVQVVVDSGAINTRYSLIKLLYQAGVKVFCYQATGLLPPFPKTFPSIMHHKFLIFENVQGLAIVASGSLNYTNAGFNGNQEQMQIRTVHTKAFISHFEQLKKRSYLISESAFFKKIEKTIPSFFIKSVKKIRF